MIDANDLPDDISVNELKNIFNAFVILVFYYDKRVSLKELNAFNKLFDKSINMVDICLYARTIQKSVDNGTENWVTSNLKDSYFIEYLSKLGVMTTIFNKQLLTDDYEENKKVFKDSLSDLFTTTNANRFSKLFELLLFYLEMNLDSDDNTEQKNILKECLKNYKKAFDIELKKLVKKYYNEYCFAAHESKKDEIKTEDKEQQDVLNELNSMIGLKSIKKEIQSLINTLKVRELRAQNNLYTPPISLHMVFSGNPGTGKTTVARLMGKIFNSMGILKKGHLVETSREDLVAGYVGQTAIKTQEVLDSALDGVLFIDEAYTLSGPDASNNDYGDEAISTILKYMEDNRDRIVVIVAGYTDEMDGFLKSNPGLSSRFNKKIVFPDYTEQELYQIFVEQCNKYNYIVSDLIELPFTQYYSKQLSKRNKHFGNAREIRNLFEEAMQNQANRVANLSTNITAETLQTFLLEDMPFYNSMTEI